MQLQITEIIDRLVFRPSYAVFLPIGFAWAFGLLTDFSLLLAIPALIVAALIAVVSVQIAIEHVVNRRTKVKELKERSLIDPSLETVEWMNRILATVWTSYPEFIEKLVKEKVQIIIDSKKEQIPKFIKNISLSKFDIGQNPPRVLFCDTNQMKNVNELSFSTSVVFSSELDIQVKTELNQGNVTFETQVARVLFEGLIQVRVRLIQNREPFVSKINVSLSKQPDLDVEVRPLRQGPDIFEVPGLNSLLLLLITEILQEQLVQPNSLEVVIEETDLIPETASLLSEGKVKGLVGGVVGSVTGGIAAVGQGVVGGVTAVGSGVVDGVSAVGRGAVSGVTAVGSGVASGVSTVGSGVVSGVSTVGSGVVSGVSTVGSGVASGVSTVGSGVVSGVSTVGHGAVDVGKGAVDLTASVGKGAVDLTASVGKGAVDLTASVGKGAVDGVSAVGKGAIGGVSAVGKGITGGIGSLGKGLGLSKSKSKTQVEEEHAEEEPSRELAAESHEAEEHKEPEVNHEEKTEEKHEDKGALDSVADLGKGAVDGVASVGKGAVDLTASVGKGAVDLTASVGKGALGGVAAVGKGITGGLGGLGKGLGLTKSKEVDPKEAEHHELGHPEEHNEEQKEAHPEEHKEEHKAEAKKGGMFSKVKKIF